MDKLWNTNSLLQQDLLINFGEGSDSVVDHDILYVKIDLVKLINGDIALEKKTNKKHKKGYEVLMNKLVCTPNDSTLNRELNEELCDENKVLIHWWCLGTILTCNNAKVNKSSVNWYNYVRLANEIYKHCYGNEISSKRVSVIGDLKVNNIDQQFVLKRCLKVAIKSIKQHPRNYYCGNGIKSMIRIFGYKFIMLLKDEIVKIDDLTLWVNWSNGLTELEDQALIVKEIEWLYCKLNEKFSVIAMMKSPSIVMARLMYWKYQNEANGDDFDVSRLSQTTVNLYEKYIREKSRSL